MGFLPPVCEQLHELAPATRLHVEQVPPAQIEEALRTGRLDFAIGSLPALKPLTRYELLFRESYACMTRRRDGLPQGERLQLEKFLAMSHVLVQSAESSHQQVEDSFRTLGIHRKIALDIPHFSVLPRILARSDLVATLPLRIARMFQNEGHGDFVVYQLPLDIPEADVTLHWHEDFHNDAGSSWIRQLIIDQLQQYGRSS